MKWGPGGPFFFQIAGPTFGFGVWGGGGGGANPFLGKRFVWVFLSASFPLKLLDATTSSRTLYATRQPLKTIDVEALRRQKEEEAKKVKANGGGTMIEVVLNDRLGKKVRVKCNSNDTVGDLKKLAAAQLGTRYEKIRIQKWYNIYKDHIRLDDYEIHDGAGLELYYM